jgi:hypothetical protein
MLNGVYGAAPCMRNFNPSSQLWLNLYPRVVLQQVRYPACTDELSLMSVTWPQNV